MARKNDSLPHPCQKQQVSDICAGQADGLLYEYRDSSVDQFCGNAEMGRGWRSNDYAISRWYLALPNLPAR
jgi:hypothetical protein